VWVAVNMASEESERQYHLLELKEQGMIVIKWKAGFDNSCDLYTKNLQRIKRHAQPYVGQ